MFNSDSFVEQVVKNGKPNKFYYLKILLSLLVIMVGWVLFAYTGVGILSIMVAPIIFVIGVCMFFIVLTYRHLEYEYTFINGSVEIAGVFKASRRKEYFHFDFDQVIMIAPANSKRFENEKYDHKSYFGSKEGNDHQIGMLVEIKQKKELIIMETDERSMNHILMYARNKCSDMK